MKEETSRQRHDTSAGGVIRDTPSNRTHALHLKPVEEERDRVSSSRSGSYDDEKRSILVEGLCMR